MQHHFIGVEHLVAGALELRGGIAASLIEQYGYKPEYVLDAIRRHAGKGSTQRLWAGVPNSPRAEVVLSIAQDLALEAGKEEISERELLRAVLEESDSIPVRVWRRLGIDLEKLGADIASFTPTRAVTQAHLRIDMSADFEGTISDAQLFVLRRMFHGYSQLRVERRLTGGYSGALVLCLTPVKADNIWDAPVVVKIDQADAILDEAQRYEAHVKATLPALTARLEERPTAPDSTEYAGLKYSLVAGQDGVPRDLRSALPGIPTAALAEWLKTALFPTFGRTWWMQRRPYRFEAWEEYDWLLPPVLTLDALTPEDAPPQGGHLIRDPVKRADLRKIEYGDGVVVAGFQLQRLYRGRDALQLAVGQGSEAARRAHKIEVRGIDMNRTMHFRGERIDQMAGRVFATRHEMLLNSLRALSPDFDPNGATIPSHLPGMRLPNPLLVYDELLDRVIQGTICTIHGDLHLGNILLGPGDSPVLIDFGHARAGHTLFDWATLEISLLHDLVMPRVGESWADARRVLARLVGLPPYAPGAPDPLLDDVFTPLEAVREIVSLCLARLGDWSEYFLPLTLCALRAMTWEPTMTPAGRRLMFLLAAHACQPPIPRARSGSGTTQFDFNVTDLSGGSGGR